MEEIDIKIEKLCHKVAKTLRKEGTTNKYK